MWVDLILLNLMAAVGTAGLSVIISLAFPWVGAALYLSGFVFVNWIWWIVHFNNFKWLPRWLS